MLGRTVLSATDLHLLPEGYLYGLALTERNSYARWAYLNGEGSHRGFPAYFLYTFFYKTPEGSILAIIAGLIALRGRRTSALPFLLWPIVIYLAVSMAGSLNIRNRAILPLFSYLYLIPCGLCSGAPQHRLWLRAAILCTAL